MPRLLRECPVIPLHTALTLFRSPKTDEFVMGLHVLFRRYPNNKRGWREFVDFVVSHSAERIPPSLIYYLAHIPWHGDIAWSGDRPITDNTRSYVKTLLMRFGRAEIVKLLECIDEKGIARGTVGQSVEAIVSSANNALSIMKDVIRDRTLPLFVRENAALILAMHSGRAAIEDLAQVQNSGSRYAQELILYIRHHGRVNPY